jgi:hypothetical protein
MTEQLPAIIERTEIIGDAPAPVVPALIATAGERASLRFLEFFAANIRNPHTRRAYSRAVSEFIAATTTTCRRSPPCSRFTSPPGSSSKRASRRHRL